jgi:DNA processing protein
MTIFGLDGAEVLSALAAVRPAGAGREEAETAFARAAWTAVAEPGDGSAGALVEAMGPVDALAVLSDRRPTSEISGRFPPALDPEALQKGLDRWRPRNKPADVLRALTQAARFGARLVVPGDDDWPLGVDDLGQFAPLALWVRGTPAALASLERGIALVGARAATGYGEHVAMEASAGLVDRGYSIVSGAAYGIDGMAHRAALASGGSTVAFLAGGVDRFYPSGHDALLTRIADVGAVVSEVPCGSAPTKWRFLQRNRLIAASSLATIVLEAGWRSGSLNTAGHAAALGRPLGAVPGPVTSAASAGTHRLIRDYDAVLVTNPDEMAELAPLSSAEGRTGEEGGPTLFGTDPSETRALDALSNRAGRTPADIAVRSGLSLADVQAVLGRLELDGRARITDRGWIRVASETARRA